MAILLPDYIGPSGLVVESIENFLPGGSTTLIGLSVLLFLLFVYRGQSLKEKSSEAVSYIVLLAIIVFILTGNVFHIMFVIFIGFAIEYADRRRVRNEEFGNRYERDYIGFQGYDYRGERRAALNDEALENQKHKSKDKDVKELTEVEKLMAEESERDMELMLHEEAIDGCTKSIADTVSALQKKEMSIEERDRKIKAAISVIDNQLSRMNNKLAINEAGQTYILQFSKNLAKLLGELIKDKEYEEGYRKNAIKPLHKGIKTIRSAVRNAKLIERRALTVERKLDSAGSKSIHLVAEKIDERKAELNKIRKKIKSMKQGQARLAVLKQATQLNNQIKQLEIEKVNLDQMHNNLKSILKNLKRTLRKLRRDLNILKRSSHEADGREKDLENFNESYGSIFKELAKSHSEFDKDMKEIETTIPEEIAIKTTQDVGSIYSLMIEITRKTIEFNKEKMSSFIDEMIEILKGSEEIARSSYYLSFFQKRLDQAFIELDKMVQAVIENKDRAANEELFQDIKDEKVQADLADYIAANGKKMIAMMQLSKKSLETANTQIAAHEAVLNKEVLESEAEEKVTLDALIKITKTLMIHKSRVHKEFLADAKKFNSRIKQAKENTMAARSAA